MQAFAAISQATGALQLIALIVAVGPGRATDAYVTLFSACQLTLSVVIFGTLQLISLAREHYDAWHRWAWAGALANVPVLLLIGIYLSSIDYPVSTVWPTAALLCLATGFASAAATRAVHRAALGAPELLAGLTILPNSVASVSVIVAPTQPVAIMCVGLLVGNVATWLLSRRGIHDVLADSDSTDRPSRPGSGEIAGLVFSSSVGTAGPFALQAVTASYPAGQATILSFFSRVGAGLVGVSVTAFVTVATDWRRRSIAPLRLAARALSFSQVVSVLLLGCLFAAPVPALVKETLVAIGWILGAGSQACAARALGMLDLLSALRRAGVVGLFLYAAATLTLVLAPPSAFLYFSILSIITLAANLQFFYALRWAAELRVYRIGLGAAMCLGLLSYGVSNA